MNPPGDIVPVIFFKILHELQLRNRRVHIVFFAETTVINTDRVEIACRECTGFVIKMSVETAFPVRVVFRNPFQAINRLVSTENANWRTSVAWLLCRY
jgi:hypothetical protein